MKMSALAKFAWFVLAFNVGVILWGAYVRATGSGAGCGSHWPLCNGEVIPRPDRIETMIEFTHRLSSGTALLLVLGLLIWTLRIYSKGNIIRKGAILSMIFMITEALIGAGLVLFELVAQDTSTTRAISISFHLVNTYLLLACLTLTAYWASGGKPIGIRSSKKSGLLLGVGLVGVLILGMSGALTALGDTLFPSSSLAEGLRQDFFAAAHFLIRLRLLHPTIALMVSIYLIVVVGRILWRGVEGEQKILGRLLTLLLLVQLFAGMVNVVLLAPVWLQLVHLLLSDGIWITLVLFVAKTFSISDIAQGEKLQAGGIISQSTSVS